MRSWFQLIFLGALLTGLHSTTVYAKDNGANVHGNSGWHGGWWNGKGWWNGGGHGHSHGHDDCKVPEIGSTGLPSALFVVLGAAAIVGSQRRRRIS